MSETDDDLVILRAILDLLIDRRCQAARIAHVEGVNVQLQKAIEAVQAERLNAETEEPETSGAGR